MRKKMTCSKEMMRTNLNGGWGGPGGIAPGGIAPGGITPGGMEALDGDRSIPGGGGPLSIPAQMPKQWQQALKPSIQDRAGPVQHSWTDSKTQWQQALKPSIQDRAGLFSIPEQTPKHSDSKHLSLPFKTGLACSAFLNRRQNTVTAST